MPSWHPNASAGMRPVSGLAALLLDRRDRGSLPGARFCGRRVALAIEGGGMRGVIAGGMVSALEELGLLNAFDVVYGASAGAIVGAYFVAGQARYGTRIFYEDINNRRFIDRRRLLRGKAVVSVDFLLDQVCTFDKPLDTGRVLAAAVPLRVLASCVEGRNAVALGGFPDRQALMEALRASARIPFFAGSPVHYGGQQLLDALLYEPIPFQAPVAEGSTDVVVLLTRPGPPPAGRRVSMERLLMERFLRALHPALADDFRGWPLRYAETLEQVGTAAVSGQPARCLPIRLAPGEGVSAMETGRAKLVAAAAAGRNAVLVAFAGAAGP